MGMNKFKQQQRVKHCKTGNVYTIVDVPDCNHKLEASNEPFYSYTDGKVTWYRSKSEMEDGRFIYVEPQDVNENVYKLEYDYSGCGEKRHSVWVRAATEAIAIEKAMEILRQNLCNRINENTNDFIKIFSTELHEE